MRFGDAPAPVPKGIVSTPKRHTDPTPGFLRPAGEPFRAGSEVTILEGPFAGLNAIYQTDCGEQCSIILLDILGNRQRVRIEKDPLWPAATS